VVVRNGTSAHGRRRVVWTAVVLCMRPVPRSSRVDWREDEMTVESIEGFDELTDHDKMELVKFEHYLRIKSEPEQPPEGAYAHV
jgi:hypothetical protein